MAQTQSVKDKLTNLVNSMEDLKQQLAKLEAKLEIATNEFQEAEKKVIELFGTAVPEKLKEIQDNLTKEAQELLDEIESKDTGNSNEFE